METGASDDSPWGVSEPKHCIACHCWKPPALNIQFLDLTVILGVACFKRIRSPLDAGGYAARPDPRSTTNSDHAPDPHTAAAGTRAPCRGVFHQRRVGRPGRRRHRQHADQLAFPPAANATVRSSRPVPARQASPRAAPCLSSIVRCDFRWSARARPFGAKRHPRIAQAPATALAFQRSAAAAALEAALLAAAGILSRPCSCRPAMPPASGRRPWEAAAAAAAAGAAAEAEDAAEAACRFTAPNSCPVFGPLTERGENEGGK